MNVLVIACHPDDEVLGCGGTILKHVKEGDKVYLCVVTNAIESLKLSKKQADSRRLEVINSSSILKIKKTFFLDLPSVRLDTIPIFEVIKKLSGVIKEVNPQVVYTHNSSDPNQDHKIVHQASIVATRPLPDLSIKKVVVYEVPSSTTYSFFKNPFSPNMFVDIESFMNRKIKALAVYKSEVKKYPHPRSGKGIKIYALFRGLMCGKKCAEAFEIIKEIK